jgi:hypothetical protein
LKHMSTVLQISDRCYLAHYISASGDLVSGIGIDPSEFTDAAAPARLDRIGRQ